MQPRSVVSGFSVLKTFQQNFDLDTKQKKNILSRLKATMVLTKVLGNGCQGDLTLQVLITYASRSFFVLTCVVSGCVAPCIMTSFHLLNATTSSTKTATAFQLFPVIFVFSLFFFFCFGFSIKCFFYFFLFLSLFIFLFFI